MKTARCVAAVMAAAALWIVAGCDDVEPSSETVKVEPSSVALKKGESATFIASGGFDYTWSLRTGQESWGHLSSLTGPTVTYTSLYDPGSSSSAVQVLTVVSIIPDMHRAQTNYPPISGEKSAEAYITHISTNLSL